MKSQERNREKQRYLKRFKEKQIYIQILRENSFDKRLTDGYNIKRCENNQTEVKPQEELKGKNQNVNIYA